MTFDYIDILLFNRLVIYDKNMCADADQVSFPFIISQVFGKVISPSLCIGPVTTALQLRAFLKLWRSASSTPGRNDSLIRSLLPLTVFHSNCTFKLSSLFFILLSTAQCTLFCIAYFLMDCPDFFSLSSRSSFPLSVSGHSCRYDCNDCSTDIIEFYAILRAVMLDNLFSSEAYTLDRFSCRVGQDCLGQKAPIIPYLD